MIEASLLHELPALTALRNPAHRALTHGEVDSDYASLATQIEKCADGFCALGLGRGQRVAIYLEKRVEMVIAAFGASAAGAVFVPINPVLKPAQVAHIVRDCAASILVTSAQRLTACADELASCADLARIVLVNDSQPSDHAWPFAVCSWDSLLAQPRAPRHRVIDTDMAAILYTSGSTGRPKGVVLSHRNMVAGAKSVASYLSNHEADSLLAALPLSFDAGFSQLTTAFHVGARVVLLNYLMPKDVLGALVRERITGLTAVPPLYLQLLQLNWPAGIDQHLRYFANTGGRMPLDTLRKLRLLLPKAKPYLMYGLTEAFRSTYLPPEEIDRRPDSIGKAIPNAEILVLRTDGTPCAADEPGELVHRGALVGMGYWNDPEKTAERYKPLPARASGLVLPELAVFSGDTVRKDDDGFLYFIGRTDEMIKTSGYRVSPAEIEEVIYSTQLVGEVAAFGVPHPMLGQAIVVVATPPAQDRTVGAGDDVALINACRERLPAYMIPVKIDFRDGPLPRNPNGKIDRKSLAEAFATLFDEAR